jgi:hypothetical protein
MLIEALQNLLAGDPGMQGFLGLPSARKDSTNGIFPTQAIEQPNMPYVVLSQVSGVPLQTSMAGTGRLMSERWRFEFCGTTYKSAKKFAKYGQSFLLGVFGQNTAGNCWIQGAWKKLEADTNENLGKGTLYSTHIDVEFEYIDYDN